MSTENIELQILEAEKKLKELKQDLELEKLKSPEHSLAETLHSMLCTHNHTDGCGWYYEFKDKQPEWDADAHKQYLHKARNLITICEQNVPGVTPDQAIGLFKLVKGL